MSKLKLEKAQSLERPSREKVLRRDYSVKTFWDENKSLLIDAWKEWDKLKENKLLLQGDSLIDEKLKLFVEEAWENPKKESAIRDLLQEVSSGVYQFQFLNPEKIKPLRDFLDRANESNIPLRAPYGIVLNRKGAMLDRRSEGYLAAPSFQSFYQEIFDKYMRPIARLLFPEITGYDTQTFGFSIQYQPEKDTSIRMHTDASSVTLNLNLNLPNEDYTGSEVDFHDAVTGKLNRIQFKTGKALIHRGNVAHMAQPITSGERTNLVLWLYGNQMQIPRYINPNTKVIAEKRWIVPSEEPDEYAPF